MKIFLFHDENGVYFLVQAESDVQAMEALKAHRPGRYFYSSQTDVLPSGVGVVAIVQNGDGMIHLPGLKLGLHPVV